MAIFTNLFRWFRGGGVLSESSGEQRSDPSTGIVSDVPDIGADGALQISTIWACIDLRSSTIASLPMFVYNRESNGQKTMARGDRLYSLLHDSPNARMTPFEFWRAMMMNYDLRGNAYARIDRDPRTGEAISLWPMPADQVTVHVLDDGSMVYLYTIDSNVAVLAEESVLHLKALGNGTIGLSKLNFMQSTTNEMVKAQQTASKLFGTEGKPTGVLMVDSVLKPEQREAVRKNFGDIATANTGRLFVLEANMKYQQLALSPEDQQLLESRRFGVEELCRWMGVPPVLVHHSNVTTWGSGIYEVKDGFYTLTLRPILSSIEQAVMKRVMTSKQRVNLQVEFNFDALLRGNIKDRYEVYAKGVQNGITTRNEARQLENLPPIKGGDDLTAQTNLVPLDLLGKIKPGVGNVATQDPQAQ